MDLFQAEFLPKGGIAEKSQLTRVHSLEILTLKKGL